MKYKFTVVSLIISFIFLGLAVNNLLNGCYRGTGNCNDFMTMKVLINNKEHITDDISLGTHYVNCEVSGIYNYNDRTKSCTIFDNRNIGACGDFLHTEYQNGTIVQLYVNKHDLDKCYAKNYIEMIGEIGLIFAILAAIFFIIPVAIFIVIKLIEHKNNTNRMNDLVEIQLNSAFGLDREKYSHLRMDDDDDIMEYKF